MARTMVWLMPVLLVPHHLFQRALGGSSLYLAESAKQTEEDATAQVNSTAVNPPDCLPRVMPSSDGSSVQCRLAYPHPV